MKSCKSLTYHIYHIIKYLFYTTGETGAGKSSFINLLLGEDILPSSMLSNTHVLCEIKYSENSAATMYPLNDKGHPKVIKCGKTFRDDLAVEIQRLDNGHSIYKRAEIYLPCPILKVFIIHLHECVC